VDEEWVQTFRDLFLVCKIKSTVVWDPDTFEVHGTNLDDMTRLLALQNAVSPSSCHTSYIQEFRAVDHVVILTTSYTNAVGLDLEAQTALVFPERSSDSGLHAWWSDLASSINDTMFVVYARRSRQIVRESCVR